MVAREPILTALPNPALRYVLATRPAFLSITLVGCLLGLAVASHSGILLHTGHAVLTILLALTTHAGVNVLNDYYDALNGTDDANTERVYPYTGGSRFIQNGVLTRTQTARFGFALLAAVIPAGLWLTAYSGPGLVGIGLAGLFIGWAYSATPLKLNSRGLGELCVMAGFALIVVGTDFVQRQHVAVEAIWLALPYALLVTNILYINQFPDRKADAAAGKRHWVVRLQPATAAWGYALIGLLAYALLAYDMWRGLAPAWTWFAFVPAVLSLRAFLILKHFAQQATQLVPAIRLTLLGAHLHGLLLAAALVMNKGYSA